MKNLRTIFAIAVGTAVASCAAEPSPPSSHPAPDQEAQVEMRDAPLPSAPSPVYGTDYEIAYELPSDEWVRAEDDPGMKDVVLHFRHEPTSAMVFVGVTAFDEMSPEESLERIKADWSMHETMRAGDIFPFSHGGMRGARLTVTFRSAPGLRTVREFGHRQLSEAYDCAIIVVGAWPLFVDGGVRSDYELLLRSFRAVPLERAPTPSVQ